MLFEKLYADLVAPDGAVYVLYLATLHVLGFKVRMAEIEAYSVGSPRRIHSARLGHRRPRVPASLDETSPLDARLFTAVGEFRFRSTLRSGAFLPAERPLPGLEWRVCMGRTEAQIDLPAALGGSTIKGIGYIDHLRVEHPTARLGLRTLEWGRAHLSRSSLVWSRLRLKDGRVWEQFARWPHPGGIATPGSLRPSEALARAQIEGAGGSVKAERVLFEGAAIDQDRVPFAPVRWLMLATAGRAHQRRCVTRIAEPGLETGGWGVHESVTFS